MAGYVKVVTISNVTLKYKPEDTFLKFVPDLFMDVELNVKDGWTDKLTIFGSVKHDLPSSDPKSWHSAFKIRTFFEKALNKKDLKLQGDHTIPEEWLRDVIGRQIKVISYPTTKTKPNGKNYWNYHNMVGSISDDDNYLKNDLQKQIDNGWVKFYQPPDNESETTTSTPDVDAIKKSGLAEALDL